jgi:PAS domain S-box-containing protein
MALELRKTGISVVGHVPWGTHFCNFYETKQDLLDTLVPYFKAGLQNKEFCLLVVSESDLITVAEAQEALAQAVPDLDRHLSEENIEILDGRDWYFEKNVLNLERVANAWDAKLKRALARGYEGLRASGDTFWLAEKDWKDFFAYEKQVNDWVTDQPMTVLCTYPLEKSGAAAVLDVVQAHQFAIARRQGEWEIIETPELIQAKAEIEKLNEELEQRVVERTDELRLANEALRKEISERNQAEDETRRQNEILQQIVDHIPVMINFVGADGRVKLVNREWERTLGWSLEEIRQQHVDVFAECYPDPQYRQQVLKFVAEAKGEWADFKTRVRDGRVIDTSWVRVHLSDGTSIGIGTNITERKQAEDALRRSEDHLRLVIDTIPTMAWSLGPDAVLDFVNQRWLDYTGLSFEEAIEDETRTVHPEDLSRVMKKWLVIKATSETYEDEMRLQRADGEYRWFLVRIAPLLDEKRTLLKRYGVATDIEERKQAEEALAERLRFETLVTELSAAFANLSPNEVDREIDKWLQTLVEFLGVDRASFLQFGDDWTMLYRSHSYTVPGIEPLPPPPIGLKDQFPWISEQLRRGITVKWARIPDDMPEEAEKEKEYAARLGVKSELNIPVLMGGSVICAISFTSIVTYRDWPDAMVARLRLVGEIFAAAVERNRTEAALHAKEQEFRAIVENAPDQIIRYDREFRRIYVNPAVITAYDLPAEALIGKPVGSVIQDAGLNVDADEVAQLRRHIASVFETGKSFEYEMSWPTPTGRKHYSVRLFPELDRDGSVINVLGIARDITERKQAEDVLRRSEDRLRLVIDTIPTMAWSLQPDGAIDFVNQRWMDYTGLSLEEAIAEPTVTMHPEDLSAAMAEWGANMAAEEPFEGEIRLRRADGEYRCFLVRTDPLRDEQGNVVKWYGAAIDIEERKQADEKLKATSERLRALSVSLQSAREEEAARIARELHDELGSALTSLRWSLDELGSLLAKRPHTSEADLLRRKVATMTTLSEGTLQTVRRISSELRPGILDEVGLVAAIKWEAQQFEERTGIVCQVNSLVENVRLTREQSTALFRIFQEALTNILRHAKATRVDVTVAEEQGEFVLTISDNGRGIIDEEKSGEKSLGLLGMRERAHLIGGEVNITGVADQGTMVTVRVPVPDAETSEE